MSDKPVSAPRPVRGFPGLLAALALAFPILSASGCAKGGKTATFGTSDELLGLGEYVSQAPDAGGNIIRLKLNQGNTYVKRKFRGTCMVLEDKGEWESTHETIEFRQQEVRRRADCSTEQWQVERSDKVAERNIRNVTPRSFELLDQDERTSAEWVKFVRP